MLTIDASVWLSGENPAEPSHTASRALLDHVAAHSIPLFLPTLLFVEAAGVIRRSSGSQALAVAYVSILRTLKSVVWMDLDGAMADRAATVAADRSLRGADAVYAAVALANACTLVSLDQEHLNRLPPLVATLTPAAALGQLTANP